MRAYFFTNRYLSSIQHGIQTAHCVAELFVKYNHEVFSNTVQDGQLYSWAENDKTIIVLNGGSNEDLITGFAAGRPLHVVVAESPAERIIVTVYEPDATLWSQDWTTRRSL